MAKKVKNPLDVMFGSFLQDERKLLTNYTIEEICQKGMLGMSSSLYKMAEAGLTSINVNRLPDLLRVFKSSDLLFDRLAKFSAGQNYVDHLMINNNLSPKDAFAELADLDFEFKHLFEKAMPYFSFEEGGIEQKRYVQENLVKEVKLFLQNMKYPISDEKEFEGIITREINAVPSLNIEILLTIINSFAKMLPQHYGTIAAEWEFENRKLFRKVEGYFTSKKYIISQPNLEIYKYNFLENGDFEQVKFIFHSPEDNHHLKEEFVKMLSDVRNAEVGPNSVKKIHFECIKKPPLSFQSLLIDPNNSKVHLDAFWVFTTITGNKIGFVGVSGKDINTVYNLTYKETLDRVKIFEDLWNSFSK